MEPYDVIRSLVTNTMLVVLLFTLAQPKYKKHTLWGLLAAIVAADLALNVFFYLRGDYTTLAALDIAFFILVGAATKPLFRETLIHQRLRSSIDKLPLFRIFQLFLKLNVVRQIFPTA